MRTAALEAATQLEDTIRINTSQNITIVSTPREDNAVKYSQIKELKLQEKRFSMTTYITAPENSARGIIHGIPDYGTQEDIIRSLARNTARVLHARRMRNTSSVIIVFQGEEVPHYVNYRNTTYRCLLYKKIEVCGICRKVGHWDDVCPTPNEKCCIQCGKQNPPTDHDCELVCAICNGNHLSGSKQCKKRFQIPYIIRQRQWQKLSVEEQNHPNERRQSRSRERRSSQNSHETSGSFFSRRIEQ
ncbi:uncharacterized protein [Dermacentor albipictus]|uniref:uncharacterized protein n=1 Tax=Dermacentor albipictus TaxID=60249 RepID=UPI0038FC280E